MQLFFPQLVKIGLSIIFLLAREKEKVIFQIYG